MVTCCCISYKTWQKKFSSRWGNLVDDPLFLRLFLFPGQLNTSNNIFCYRLYFKKNHLFKPVSGSI
jgi:hypothetical protein